MKLATLKMDGLFYAVKTAIIYLWLWLSWLLMPVSAYMVFTAFLVLCDLFTGVQAARKRNEAINSKGLGRSVVKISVYFIAVLIARGATVVFLPNSDFDFVHVVAGLIALTEIKSNFENIATVTGMDLLAEIAGYLPKFLKIPNRK